MTENSPRKTILVVDDDEHLRLLTQTALRHFGYSVITAVSGQQALARLAMTKVDLMIVDVNLTDDMDGIDLLKQIRAQSATADLPVMILSAHSQYSEVARGLEAGAEHYMTKPFEISEITRNVRRILASREE
jgi:DNA-binding response OmpR family regulator